MTKDKVVEIINLRQGGMSVHKYSLKLTKLSKYAPSLVYDPRDKMRPFVMEVSDNLKWSVIRYATRQHEQFISYNVF